MRPGRELDKLVFEAMGGKVDTTKRSIGGNPTWIDKNGFQYYEGEYSPSTDIDQAMDLWEWLEKESPWGQIALGRSKGQPCVLQLLPPVTKNFPHSWGIEEVATGETYPHAICLAVLEAKKEEEEDFNQRVEAGYFDWVDEDQDFQTPD
jgi:hypothetical protein